MTDIGGTDVRHIHDFWGCEACTAVTQCWLAVALDEIDRLRDVRDDWQNNWPAKGLLAECRRIWKERAELRVHLAEVQDERDEHRDERHRLMKLVSVRESEWEATKARLAAVEALCAESDNWDGANRGILHTSMVRASLRGEGDQ